MSDLSLSYWYCISTSAQRSPFSFLQGLSMFFTLSLGFLSDVRARFLEEKRKGCISQESPLSNAASRVWLLLLTTMKENLLTSRALNVQKSVFSAFPFRHIIQRHCVWFPLISSSWPRPEDISNRKFPKWPNWWRKERKIKLLEYIWRKTHKSHSPWSRGNWSQFWLTESSQQLHPLTIYFCLSLPPPPKSLCRSGFLISHWKQESGCSQSIRKALHHSPGHWSKGMFQGQYSGCACHF